MKRIMAMILILCSLFLLSVEAYAENEMGSTPDPSSSAERSVPVSISIDNQNVYEGMDMSFSEGYIPRVTGGYAVVVLPLLCEGTLAGNQLCASVDLGNSATIPFVCKNYEKTVSCTSASIYLVSFSLELKHDRTNGNYPVSVSVTATDSAGNGIRETFTVYVVITDGKEPQIDHATEEESVLIPKVLVRSYMCTSLSDEKETEKITAGDRFRVNVSLVNTGQSVSLENLSVSAASPEGFGLLSVSDTQFVGHVDAGATFEVAFEYSTNGDIPAGQYGVTLAYDYAFGKGQSSSGSGTAMVTVTQPLQMELAVIQMPDKAVISDTISVGVQAINLSRAKAYNVRAVVEADGFSPMGTIFLGDVDGGMSIDGTGQVAVTGLTRGNFSYGQTKGTVTFYYEDSDGNELTEIKNFTAEIESPFSQNPKPEEDAPGQWWIIMAVIAGGIAVGGILIVIQKRKEHKCEKTV